MFAGGVRRKCARRSPEKERQRRSERERRRGREKRAKTNRLHIFAFVFSAPCNNFGSAELVWTASVNNALPSGRNGRPARSLLLLVRLIFLAFFPVHRSFHSVYEKHDRRR